MFFFGEYTYGVIEAPDGEHFENVKDFDVWVITPSGKKQTLSVSAADKSFQGTFTPKEKGTYTVVLNNNRIDVIDYTEYNFGIFKTHYHSTAKVVVGENVQASHSDNQEGLSIVNVTDERLGQSKEVALQVLFKGAPLANQEIVVYVADQWSKTLKTDESGQVTFALPWSTQYTIETTKKENVPGEFRGEAYEFIWHCATYSIKV